jgi:hypothetical protein
MVKHAGRIVQDIAVNLAGGDNCLERMAERVVDGDQVCEKEGERSPHHL